MADWKKVEKQIEKLIADGNEKLETAKTNLTDIVEELLSGYGQGSGGSSNIWVLKNGEKAQFYLLPVLEILKINTSITNIITHENLWNTASTVAVVAE